jgi:hypothetical protein
MKTIYEAVINNEPVRVRYHFTGVCEVQAVLKGYPFHICTFDNMVEAIKYVKALKGATK